MVFRTEFVEDYIKTVSKIPTMSFHKAFSNNMPFVSETHSRGFRRSRRVEGKIYIFIFHLLYTRTNGRLTNNNKCVLYEINLF